LFVSQQEGAVGGNFVASSTLIEEARKAATALVDREEATTRSRMVAYERVAQMTGASPSWLRKFISGYEEAKQPNFVTGYNILQTYQRMMKTPQ
jgi:hypothetical protein